MVVAEARRPPVFQQARREAIAIVASFEIAVVQQNFECIRNTAGCIVNYCGVQPFEATPCAWREYVLSGCLGEDLHGDGVALIFQRLLEARLVVYEVVLPWRPEELRAIDFPDVLHRHLVPALHNGVVPQPCEEGLHMVGNTDAERIVHRVCHVVLDSQAATFRETLKTLDTSITVPRP